MSIIIHFNTATYIPSSTSCQSRAKVAMVPGIDETDQTVMTDDESSLVDIATSNTLYTHSVSDLKSNHVLGSCFGLPYQDHNYGAPPPPTPPSYSPCASPAHANGVPDEDTNLSIVSTSTANEETQERSITRCICGFAHDDEYMICCDHCLVWQHVDCMGLDRNNIPETYMCEKCEPRKVDRHKAKVLQTRKKVAMTDSSDSEEDRGGKNSERKPKSRKRKRKEEGKIDEKTEVLRKRNKQINKHTKERIEAKRSRLRRNKNKESTSTADEEAQDAWEISLEWCEKNFETAVNNQYTPEVQHLAKNLPLLGHENRFMELLLTRNCQVIDGHQKKVISVYDIPRDQPLIEYKGKFLLASQFSELHPAFSKRLFPFVIFYSLNQDEICIDASVYGNEARFIRRSCKPNAELRHLVHRGNLHLYVSSTKAVFKDDEITLPHDFSSKESIKDVDCACESEDCILKFHLKNGSFDASPEKKRKGKKLTFSADDDSSHSLLGMNATSPTKCKLPVKYHSQISETLEGRSDHETEESERKKKTREERKLDAIMRAFDQMEKAEKRRQQALERQKTHHPKSEEASGKSESICTKEDDKVTTASGSETQGGEEEKPHISAPKSKKGKRRRGSGTPSRRRTRTNSGGSDIMLLDENVLVKNASETNVDIVTTSCSVVESIADTNNCSTATILSPVLPNVSPCPQMKKFFLREWLQESSETNTNPPATSPVSVCAEVKLNSPVPSSTYYVQCTKNNPHSGGISAAHLRRSSAASQIKPCPLKSYSEQGFTKKRWLRQAMFDSSENEPLTIDPGGIEGFHLDNGCLSPTCQVEMGSPGAADDTVTPLKKRRLMRESLEAAASPMSPTNQSPESCNTASNSMNESNFKSETTLDDSDQLLLHVKTECSHSDLTLTSKENSPSKSDGLRVDPSESPVKSVKEVNESIKEETNISEASTSASNVLEYRDSEPNFILSPHSRDLEPSMQSNCDLEDKAKDNPNSDCVEEKNMQKTQNTCKINDVDTCNKESILVDVSCDDTKQSDSETDINKPVDKPQENIKIDNTCECTSVPQKNNSDLQPAVSEDVGTSSLGEGSSQINNDVYASQSELATSETEVQNTLCKFPDNNVNIVTNSSNQPVTSKSTKDNVSNLDSQYPDLQSSVPPVKEDGDLPVGVAIIHKNESLHADIASKKLVDLNSDDSKLCLVSPQSDDVNGSKVKEFSCLDSKTSEVFSENSSSLKTINVSATQKRKVSLSEYRLRMKDGSSKRITPENMKRSASCPATVIPETLPEQVTLAPLPLFETSVGSKSPPENPISPKNTKKKKETTKSEESSLTDVTEHRENLTERLKREFGFDDDSEVSSLSHTKSISGSTCTMPLCAQPPPPPPPPPPPRPIRPSQTNINMAAVPSPSQFGFSMSTPYARPSYIVSQVPRAQFIPMQQSVNTPTIPLVHSITSPGVQCSVRTSLLPTPHSFAPSLPGTVLGPSIQHEYSSVNAQNFAALVQQPPPPPPPKTYPHVYQPGLYK